MQADDFYTTDQEVLSKIEGRLAEDEFLALLFDRMNNRITFHNDPRNYDNHVFCKSRVADPLYHYQGGIKRVSEIDQDFCQKLAEGLNPKEYFIKFDR